MDTHSSKISKKLTQKATVAFIGTFYTDRGASQQYAEGKRRWRLIKGFRVEKDLGGNIKAKEVEIDPYLKNSTLEDGEQYNILLNPSKDKLQYITGNATFNYYHHLISKEDIISIKKVE